MAIKNINGRSVSDIQNFSGSSSSLQNFSGGNIPTSDETHVFLLAGQSNMVGRPTFDGGAGYPSGTLQYPKATGYPTYTDTTTIAASPPLGHWDAGAGDMGLALQFCIDYKYVTGATIVLIPAADGNTGFQDGFWNPGDSRYNHAVDATNALMNANPMWLFKGILWHQGESDSLIGNRSNEADFSTALYKMIQQMREDITRANQRTPFILGELFVGGNSTDAPGTGNVAVIDNTPVYNYFVAKVSSASLSSYDNLHFDAASLRTFGTRYRSTFSGLSNPYPTAEPGNVGHWIFGRNNQLYIDLTESATNLTENGTTPTFEYNLLEIAGQGDGLLSAITEPANLTMCLVVEFDTNENAILNGTLTTSGASSNGVSMYFDTGSLKINERGGFATQTVASSSAFTAGNYYFIAMSVDTSDNYVGYLGDSTSTTVISGTGGGRSASTRALSVGDVHYNDAAFTGTPKVAEAIFFDSAKTEAELDAIYTRSVTRMSARNITVQ